MITLKRIGDQFGPFDLALLECGQYNEAWRYIHMLPEEAVKAGFDLKAKMTMPVHSGKFALALHGWREPLQRFSQEANKLHLPYTTPRMGEPISLRGPFPQQRWWEENK